MKTLNLSIALAMSFVTILAANGYVGENADINLLTQSESMYSLVEDDVLPINTIIAGTESIDGGYDDTVDCNDPMDDLCDGV